MTLFTLSMHIMEINCMKSYLGWESLNPHWFSWSHGGTLTSNRESKYPHNGGSHEDRDLENCTFWGLVFYGHSNRSAAAFAPLRRTPPLGFIRLFRLLLTKRAMGRRGGQKPRGGETNSFWLSSFSQSDAGESLHISVTVLLARAN